MMDNDGMDNDGMDVIEWDDASVSRCCCFLTWRMTNELDGVVLALLFSRAAPRSFRVVCHGAFVYFCLVCRSLEAKFLFGALLLVTSKTFVPAVGRDIYFCCHKIIVTRGIFICDDGCVLLIHNVVVGAGGGGDGQKFSGMSCSLCYG